MIARLRTWFGSFTARDFGVLLNVILLGVHGLLLGIAVQRTQTAESLQSQTENLRANLGQISDVEQETRAELEQRLATSQRRVKELRAELPVVDQPYPVYTRAYSLAQEVGLALLSVTREEPDVPLAEEDQVEAQIYTIEALGRSEACLDMLERIEGDGGITLATNRVRIDPSSETCGFEVITVWLNAESASVEREGAE